MISQIILEKMFTCLEPLGSLMKYQLRQMLLTHGKHFYSFQSSVTFHIETSHLIFSANQMTDLR